VKRLKRYIYAALTGGLLTACLLWYVVSDSIVDALLSSDKSAAVAAFAVTGTDTAIMDENAEEWQLKSSDSVKLAAVAYRCGKDTHRWAVIVHGYSSCKENMLSYAKAYYKRGFNVLLPDLRCHGESGGEITGMGWLDRIDLLGWINKITGEDSKALIVLHGISMGGSAVLMVSGEKLCDNVKAIVSDCAYTSVWDVIQWQVSRNFLKHNSALLLGGSLITQMKGGYTWKQASALNQVKKSSTPTLFIHGSADAVVPVSMVYELYNAAACPKKLMIVEGAGHAASMRTDRDNYWLAVFGFYKDNNIITDIPAGQT
jgi:fermentation-respiration switch protein FrsA (DUF1100 family)